MKQSKNLPRPISVIPKKKFILDLEFDDGIKGLVDLSYLRGRGIFEFWNEEENFSKVHIDRSGGIIWNDEVDIDSLNCYLKITNQTFEEYANR